MGRFIPPPPGASAWIVPRRDAAVAAALTQGMRLVERATGQGLAFALDELGEIVLPEAEAARIDRAQLRALASLYLAAGLEPAGIIVAVESLAGLSASGALQLNLAAAEPLVAQWWHNRHERMSDDERNAFFARLFGTSSGPVAAEASRNVRFEDRMLELVEALGKLDPQGGFDSSGTTMAQARVRSAARNLAQNLGDASGGMTAFIASELMATLKDAFAVLGNPALRGAFQARDIWDVVRGIARLGHASTGDAQPYVRRGKAGMIVLSWLADVLERLGSGGPIVQLGDPVIAAAVDWLEATLLLGETTVAPASPVAGTMPDRPAAVWSALAG
ncbi:MAG TPA: hypothetical protein VHG29_10495 [Novosphingobium sp.]|nr:hypothetical protein [Novosphingobium sp.]